jgi:hypothetical protein
MLNNETSAEKLFPFASFKNTILSTEDLPFEEMAMQLFRFQAQHLPAYRQWIDLLGLKLKDIKNLTEIPFLPIQFFKSHDLRVFQEAPKDYFLSSGTGGYGASKHAVYDLEFYDRHSLKLFEDQYGPVAEYFVAALLPSYLERKGSSLIRMADNFIKASDDPESAFFLNDLAALQLLLRKKTKVGAKILLLGVSFALMDLAEAFPQNLAGTIIMETGGMKGRRAEITRQELHQKLKVAFGVEQIHSEYGMTELMSQAYSKGAGLFAPAPTLKVLPRQIEDPFTRADYGRAAGLNLIDLANVHTCAFIESQDLGRVYEDGSFEVLGRYDHSEIRGCNLMVR